MKIKDKVFINKELLGKFEKNIPGIIIDTWGSGFEVKEISTGYVYRCFKEEVSTTKLK